MQGRRRSWTQREQVTCLTPTPEEQEVHKEQLTENDDTAVSGRGVQEPVHDAALLRRDALANLSLSLEEETDPLEKNPPPAEGPKPGEEEAPMLPNGGPIPATRVTLPGRQARGGLPEQGLLKTFWPDEIRFWRKHRQGGLPCIYLLWQCVSAADSIITVL